MHLKLPVLSGPNYRRGGVESNKGSNQANITLNRKPQQANLRLSPWGPATADTQVVEGSGTTSLGSKGTRRKISYEQNGY